MYNYKVYSIDWSFKFPIPQTKIKEEVRFTSNINSWQWELVLLLDYNFENATIVNTDIIKVYLWTTLLYTWIVQDVKRVITNNYEEIELPLLWLWTLATYILYNDSWYTFTKSQDPSQTIKDIIDYINSVYTWSWLNYDTSIETYWTSVDIDFDYDTCFEALQKCIETTNFSLFINWDWKVYFWEKPVTATHKLTVWKDIEQIIIDEDSENIVNKLILKWKSWTNTYEDITSQTTYWLKEKYIEKTDLATTWTADEYWNNYILQNKNPVNKTRIIINKNYNIESIKVWDTIQVKNFKFTINNLQVYKTSYTWDKLELELENFDSFWKEFIS
jgi:hypothetical protein